MRRNEESRQAIETTRAYLESILGNLSAGVLAFDDKLPAAHGELERRGDPAAAARRSHRHAALRMGPQAAGARAVRGARRGTASAHSRDGPWQKEAALTVGNLTRSLLMRGTRLPGAPVPGYVVVFDDVSELLQAQRDAAWAEVARRLAHEIKNPLTPIQLSAERLAVKLDGKLEGAEAETLKRGTQTIVNQVQAMKQMVDDFAIYARTPRPGQMQPVDLSALLLDVLALYDNLRPHTSLALPDVAGGHPGRAHPPPPGVSQSPAECHRCPSRAATIRAYAISLARADGEARLSVADGGDGLRARRARAGVRALRDDESRRAPASASRS